MPWIKRLFDLIITSVALIVLSPFILVLAMLVRIFIGAPVFFHQERAGYKGRPFFVHKFRTMTNAVGGAGKPLPDDIRLTRFGRFFRSLSLDELPELFNILRGEMSLVGPRPLLMEYLPLYNAAQMRRHDVYPGLTGWAQINGRNALDWPTRFSLDVWYVDNWSFWLDIKILLLTIGKIIRRDDITQPGRATTDYFRGNQD
jgi:sugar transferase EpsL